MFNPKKINSEERRRYPRVIVPVLYRSPRISSRRRRVSNLSLGGVRIFSDERLKLGECMELEFFLPNGLNAKAIARTVWIRELPDEAEAIFDVGFEFVEMSIELRQIIKDVVEENL